MMFNRLTTRRHESGFTLVELLIVVLILGALASTVVIAAGGFKDKGADSACRTALSSYETAFEAFRADDPDGQYPKNDGQVVPGYLKRAGSSSATTTGSATVVKGKGWTFTVTYGAAAPAGAGSLTAPAFSAISPAGCTSV